MTHIKTLKRLLDVGTTLTGIGIRIGAQEYLSMNIDEAAYAQKLRQTFGTLKGPFMKIVQFLATIPNALPPEFSTEFLTLQSNAPSMGESFVRRRMAGELGLNWKDKFQEFSLQASHAASLGQIHKATSIQGEELAVKLQYPDMEAIIGADLQQLNLALSIYQTFNNALDTQDITEEIKDRLYEELDYNLEVQNLDQFRTIFAEQFDFIIVPKVFPNLSTKRLLTMQWIDGQSALSYTSHSNKIRNELGKRLFLAWYWPLYHHGILHGDPHPGNYLVLKNLHIALLDFGCVRRFEKPFLQAVIDLYVALKENKPDLAVDAYRRWGFPNLCNELIEVLNLWARLLYEPLLEDKVRPIQDSVNGQKGWKIACEVHKKLHELGGIKPPREFVFMDRAAVGIGSVLMRLNAKQNWHRLFEEMIENIYSN